MRTGVRSEISTIGVAFVVTLLIWLWAEGQNVTRQPISVQVNLPEIADGDLLLTPQGAAEGTGFDGSVRLVFEGSISTLERLEDLRGSVLQIAPGSTGLPSTAGASQVVNLLSALRAHPDIARLSATLYAVEPETVVVSATRLASRELPVRVELARSISLDSDPVAALSRVRVRVPEAQAGRLNDQAFALAFVSEDQLLGLQGEGTESVKASLRLPESLGEFDAVRFQPDTLNVTLRVRQKLEQARLPANVPVWLALPPTERTDRWEIEILDKFLPEVTVSGPPEQLAKLGRPGTAIKAIVEIGTDDLNKAAEGLSPVSPTETGNSNPSTGQASSPNGSGTTGTTTAPGVITKPVLFTGLPPGVTPVGQPPQVRIRIAPVAPTASSPTVPADAPPPGEVPGGTPQPTGNGGTSMKPGSIDPDVATRPLATPSEPTVSTGNAARSSEDSQPDEKPPAVPTSERQSPNPNR